MDGNRAAAFSNAVPAYGASSTLSTGQQTTVTTTTAGVRNLNWFPLGQRSSTTTQSRVTFANQQGSQGSTATKPKYPDRTDKPPPTDAPGTSQPGKLSSLFGLSTGYASALTDQRRTSVLPQTGHVPAVTGQSQAFAMWDPGEINSWDIDDPQDDVYVPPAIRRLGRAKTYSWPWSRLMQIQDPAFWAQLLVACYDTDGSAPPEVTDIDAMVQSVYQYFCTRAEIQVGGSLFGPQTDNLEVTVIRVPVLRDGQLAYSYFLEKPLIVRYLHPETRKPVDKARIRPFPPVTEGALPPVDVCARSVPPVKDNTSLPVSASSNVAEAPLIDFAPEPTSQPAPSTRQSRISVPPLSAATQAAAQWDCMQPATYVQQRLVEQAAARPSRPADQEYQRRLQEQVDQMPVLIQQLETRMRQHIADDRQLHRQQLERDRQQQSQQQEADRQLQRQQQELDMQQQRQGMEMITQQLAGRSIAQQPPESLRLPVVASVPVNPAVGDDQSDISSVQGRTSRWASARSDDDDGPPPPRMQRAKSLADLGSVANLAPGQFKLPKLTLDAFTGLDADSSVDEWLHRYRSQMAAYGYTADHDLVRFLPFNLKGTAAEWYQSYLDSQSDLDALIWAQVVDDLRQQYHITDEGAQYGIFKALRPQHGESLMAYANKLEAALHRALLEATKAEKNRELVNIFMENVPASLRSQLKALFVFFGAGPPDFRQLRTFAAKWEMDQKMQTATSTPDDHEAPLRAQAAVLQTNPSVGSYQQYPQFGNANPGPSGFSMNMNQLSVASPAGTGSTLPRVGDSGTDHTDLGRCTKALPEIVLQVDGHRVQAIIDSGAQTTTLSSHFYSQIHPEWDGQCLQKPSVSLYGFMADQPALILGTEYVKLTFGEVTIGHQILIANDPRGTFTMLIGQDINCTYAHTLCEYKKTVRYNCGALRDVEIPFITPSMSRQVGQPIARMQSLRLPSLPTALVPEIGLKSSAMSETLFTPSIDKVSLQSSQLVLDSAAKVLQTPTPGHSSSEVVRDTDPADTSHSSTEPPMQHCSSGTGHQRGSRRSRRAVHHKLDPVSLTTTEPFFTSLACPLPSPPTPANQRSIGVETDPVASTSASTAAMPAVRNPKPSRSCFHCHQPGHIVSNCEFRNICNYCKQSGHVISNCPIRPPCAYCKQHGHHIRSCEQLASKHYFDRRLSCQSVPNFRPACAPNMATRTFGQTTLDDLQQSRNEASNPELSGSTDPASKRK